MNVGLLKLYVNCSPYQHYQKLSLKCYLVASKHDYFVHFTYVSLCTCILIWISLGQGKKKVCLTYSCAKVCGLTFAAFP